MGKVIFWKRINYSINYFIIIIPIKTCFSTQIFSHSHSSEKLTEVGPIFTFSSILYLPWSRLINMKNKWFFVVCRLIKMEIIEFIVVFLISVFLFLNINIPLPSSFLLLGGTWNLMKNVIYLDLVNLIRCPRKWW